MKIVNLIWIPLIVVGCEMRGDKSLINYKKFFYDNGELMKEGYFNEKSQPVDTLKTYSKDGKLMRLEKYDSAGNLNGINILYYPNGNIEQKRCYYNNILTGKVYNYYNNGKLKSIGFAKNGFFVGDRVHFYENGNYKAYNFLDFYEHNAITQLYDSLINKRVRNDGDYIVIDSMEYRKDSICLDFLLAHPPHSRNEIYLEEIDNKENKISMIKIPDSSLLFNIFLIKKPTLKSVILRVTQFDSLENKKRDFNNRYDLYE